MRKRIHIVVLACLPLLMAALGLAAEPISAETVTVDPPVEAVSTPAWDGTETVSLEEAVAIAFSNSLALKLAHLNLDEAELNLRQVEANNLVRPSPTALIEARRRLEIAVQQLRLEEFDLKLQVEEDFYSVLKAQNLARVSEEALDLSRRQLEVAEQKLLRGAETQADLLSALSEVAQAEANVAQAQGGLELALLNFRRTLGVDLERTIVPQQAEFTFQPTHVSLDEDVAFALAHRIEVLQLMMAVEATAKQVELSDNDYTPELALRMAQIALAKAENQLEQLRRGIQLEIRQAHLAMSDGARRIPALEKRVEEAEENLRVATHLYEVDMAPLLQVMGAQTALNKAKIDYIHAIFDYNLARARYDRAVARPLRNGETD